MPHPSTVPVADPLAAFRTLVEAGEAAGWDQTENAAALNAAREAFAAMDRSVILSFDSLFRSSRDQTVEQVLDDLLVTALEGGSNHWLASFRKADKDQPSTDSVWYASAVQDDVRVIAREMSATKHEFTAAVAFNGLKRLAAEFPARFQEVLEGQDDAETADVWLQLALLGEVVYG